MQSGHLLSMRSIVASVCLLLVEQEQQRASNMSFLLLCSVPSLLLSSCSS